jgi:hypothetical protein
LWGLVDWGEPDYVDAEILEVVEFASYAGDVAPAIAVGV